MIDVREAVAADIAEVSALLGELFAQEAEFEPHPACQERGLSAIVGSPETGCVLVAVADQRIVGTVGLLYTVSTALGARVALLEDLVVVKDMRGRGIGAALIAAAKARARADGAHRITLLTDGDNTAAQAFYERYGFSRSGMVPYRLML